MTKYPEIFQRLSEPFTVPDVKSFTKGKTQLAYITARTAMNRLDDVVGPENWWDRYVQGAESVMCLLTIVMPDGKEITKCDAGGYAGMSDSGDDDKSGFSDAFKRAAVKFGVGRHLYRDGIPDFMGPESAPSQAVAPTKPEPPPMRATKGAPPTGDPGDDVEPLDGAKLLLWAKDQQEDTGIDIPAKLAEWARLPKQDFPRNIGQWTEAQALRGYNAAVKLLDKAKAAV